MCDQVDTTHACVHGLMCITPESVGCVCSKGWTKMGDYASTSDNKCDISLTFIKVACTLNILGAVAVLGLAGYLINQSRNKTLSQARKYFLAAICTHSCVDIIFSALKLHDSEKESQVGYAVFPTLLLAIAPTAAFTALVLYFNILLMLLEKFGNPFMTPRTATSVSNNLARLQRLGLFIPPFALLLGLMPMISIILSNYHDSFGRVYFIGLGILTAVYAYIFDTALRYILREYAQINDPKGMDFVTTGMGKVYFQIRSFWYIGDSTLFLLALAYIICGCVPGLLRLSTYVLLTIQASSHPIIILLVIKVSKVTEYSWGGTQGGAKVIPSQIIDAVSGKLVITAKLRTSLNGPSTKSAHGDPPMMSSKSGDGVISGKGIKGVNCGIPSRAGKTVTQVSVDFSGKRGTRKPSSFTVQAGTNGLSTASTNKYNKSVPSARNIFERLEELEAGIGENDVVGAYAKRPSSAHERKPIPAIKSLESLGKNYNVIEKGSDKGSTKGSAKSRTSDGRRRSSQGFSALAAFAGQSTVDHDSRRSSEQFNPRASRESMGKNDRKGSIEKRISTERVSFNLGNLGSFGNLGNLGTFGNSRPSSKRGSFGGLTGLGLDNDNDGNETIRDNALHNWEEEEENIEEVVINSAPFKTPDSVTNANHITPTSSCGMSSHKGGSVKATSEWDGMSASSSHHNSSSKNTASNKLRLRMLSSIKISNESISCKSDGRLSAQSQYMSDLEGFGEYEDFIDQAPSTGTHRPPTIKESNLPADVEKLEVTRDITSDTLPNSVHPSPPLGESPQVGTHLKEVKNISSVDLDALFEDKANKEDEAERRQKISKKKASPNPLHVDVHVRESMTEPDVAPSEGRHESRMILKSPLDTDFRTNSSVPVTGLSGRKSLSPVAPSASNLEEQGNRRSFIEPELSLISPRSDSNISEQRRSRFSLLGVTASSPFRPSAVASVDAIVPANNVSSDHLNDASVHSNHQAVFDLLTDDDHDDTDVNMDNPGPPLPVSAVLSTKEMLAPPNKTANAWKSLKDIQN